MLTHAALADTLRELKQGLAELYGARLRGVYLFGSYARGDADSESDIDVLIVLDRIDGHWAEIQRTSALGARLSLDCGVTIAKVFIREDEWRQGDTPFLANVRGEAIAA